MIRTLIIDDEAHNRDTLRKMLARHCPQAVVVGEAGGVTEGVGAIGRLNPDLVFLDINLGDGSGFDLLQELESIRFQVIFISAVDGNPVQRLFQAGVQFLVKPVSPEHLVRAVSRAVRV
jgi:two-component system LytT family response regulator